MKKSKLSREKPIDPIKVKDEVREYFDKSEYWHKKLYRVQSHPFDRLLIRLKEHAFMLIDRIKELETGSVLDIGCGSGAYAEELIKRGFDTYGVDISQGMLDACKTRLGISEETFQTHFKRGDIEEIPFEDGTFHLVLCVGVLGNLLSDEKALRELFRVLKRGGFLLVTVDNLMSLSNLDYILRRKVRMLLRSRSVGAQEVDSEVAMPLEWMRKHVGTYYRIFNPWKLNNLVRMNGFRIIDSLTAGNEFRILRRHKLLPESFLTAVELGLEKLFRRYHIPYFSYSGQFYTGLFQKATSG